MKEVSFGRGRCLESVQFRHRPRTEEENDLQDPPSRLPMGNDKGDYEALLPPERQTFE